MTLSAKEIKEILAVIEASGWDEAQVTVGDVTLTVSKGGNGLPVLGAGQDPPPAAPAPALPEAPAPAAAPAAPDAAGPAVPAAAPAAGGHVVASPTVGVFWRSPEPGAPPFVDVGDTVAAGQTLCIVEVMKLMNHVVADVAGTVTAVHPANGETVEHGTPLFTFELA